MKTTPLAYLVISCSLIFCFSCNRSEPEKNTDVKSLQNDTVGNYPVKIVVLDPGHFHAALVQKYMYTPVDPVVHVYAPEGNELRQYLKTIESYNLRGNDPTYWDEKVYAGNDYFSRMLAEKAGNVVVISGNNHRKTEYIFNSVRAGFNVLADKPMAIDRKDFRLLRKAFDLAERNKLLLYDIMTERFEITTILQRELSMIPGIFGELERGSPGDPAVTKESVHHFYKEVSGSPLVRPVWFYDASQQGEGLVDVTTHLADLVQWECFPGQVIDYTKDITINSSRRWATDLTLKQFRLSTNAEDFPGFLQGNIVNDSILKVYCNGEISYRIRGVHAKVSVSWGFRAPEGAGDSHRSVMRGTKASLVILQGPEQDYLPSLYIEPVFANDAFEKTLTEDFSLIRDKYPGVELKKKDENWEVIIPRELREGHEAHFARVTDNYLGYLMQGNIPGWEVPNMIAKYYLTTKALQLAQKK